MGFFKRKRKPKSKSKNSSQDTHSRSQPTAPNTSSPAPTLSPPEVSSQTHTLSPHLASNADLQDNTPTTIMSHANTSTSNISTVSTLFDITSSPPARPVSPTLSATTLRRSPNSHERARAEVGRAQFEAMMARERVKAEKWRTASNSWPHDPWRGGFGPPVSAGIAYGRREAGGRDGTREWLERNGMVRR